MIVWISRTALLAIVLALAVPASAHDPTALKPSSSTVLPAAAQGAAKVVDRFHAALRSGDTRSALSFLDDQALIFEGGSAERGKAEYAAEHLGADATYSQAVPAEVTRRAGEATGSLAWIATEGRATGAVRGKPVDHLTTETMILRRNGGSWKIVHIHWSSASTN